MPTKVLNISFFSEGGYTIESTTTFLFEYVLPGFWIEILSIIFLNFEDLKVCVLFPKDIKSIRFVFVNAFSFDAAIENEVSSFFEI